MSRVEKNKKNRKNVKEWFMGLESWKRITVLVVLVLVLALIIGGIAVYGYFKGVVDEMHEPTPEDYDLSLVDVDGYINILLLGVDSRDMKNINGTRSDMIMIASINKETNDVTLTSVYRDTFLKIGDTSTYDKITHACVYGGPEMTMKTLNQALDLNISNYAVVNFKAVADLVDAVGGITVDVQEGEIFQLNKYTKQTAKNIGREKYKLVEAAGEQTLEGVQAVSYGRIRKGVGDDIKRTERMRIVVSKVFEKAKAMSFSDLKDIIDMMVPQVKTNLKMNDILALGIRLPQYNISSGSGWPYKWTTGYVNKVSYVFPAGGLALNTTLLHQEVFGQADYTPSPVVNTISNEILARIEAARNSQSLTGEKDGERGKDENLGGGKKDPTDDEGGNTGDGSGQVQKPETPTDPETPIDPESPEKPTEPQVPTDPETPIDPEAPEKPTEPQVPTDPETPITPPASTGGSQEGNTSQGTGSGAGAA